MRVFQILTIERYISYLINNDKEVTRVYITYGLEKEEIIKLLAHHFKAIGIYSVRPNGHSQLIRARNDSTKILAKH